MNQSEGKSRRKIQSHGMDVRVEFSPPVKGVVENGGWLIQTLSKGAFLFQSVHAIVRKRALALELEVGCGKSGKEW